MTLKSLQANLRRLAGLQTPEALKNKLLADIPHSRAQAPSQQWIQWHRGAWDFGVTAVAAVLIIALMFMVNYAFYLPPRGLLTQLKDTSLCYTTWDQNNFLCDYNNASAQSFFPYEIQSPKTNQNEQRY